MSTVSQARKAKYGNLSIRKAATGVNGKGRKKNLKLWEVSAKDEKKNGKAYLGTNGEKEGEGSVTCTKAQGKCEWYKEWKNLQTMKSGANAAAMEEKRSYDEKRGKTPLLLLLRHAQMMKSAYHPAA